MRPVRFQYQTDPSHAELYKTFLTDSHIVIPENVSKLQKAAFTGSHVDPTLMELLSHLTVVKLFTTIHIEYEWATLRSSSALSRSRTRSSSTSSAAARRSPSL